MKTEVRVKIVLTLSAPNTQYNVLLNSPELSLLFPCKQLGEFHLRQTVMYNHLIYSPYQITDFVWTM